MVVSWHEIVGQQVFQKISDTQHVRGISCDQCSLDVASFPGPRLVSETSLDVFLYIELEVRH